MTLSVAELRKRIEQGEGLQAINRSLISPAEQGLLRCCALVRIFDEKLVDRVFRAQVPGADAESVPFSVLTSYDFVRRVPRSDGFYSLLPANRKQYYESWWESSGARPALPRSEVPPALRELSLKLLEHYASLGDDGKLDLLAQQVFVDKEKACDLFEELYKAADSAFNLARCSDIINVLTGFENVLGPVLAKALNDTRRYLEARSLWANEYYQTVSYYDRKELSSELETFLAGNAKPDGEKKWILHLHAPGGMGKTMFVRWLIARRCAPQPYTIPCGRVDFDFVNRITVSQHRWQLFLKIADELEKQIPGNYFHSLIGKFTDYHRILTHQQSQQVTSTTTTQLPPREKLEEEMLYLFGNALRDAHLEKPIVLIFDTLEEVILYYPENLLEIVRQINTLRQAFPNVLLVLSGRYDLSESGPETTTRRLPQFNEEFGAVTQTIRVEPFEKEEALGFLQLRGLTKDRPLEAVVERAEGNPFKLALFADILSDDPEITAETIRSYPSVDLHYLIERVLARLPNKTLHWLLRYGVVPRKLTRSFVEDVMQKHLRRAMSGDDQLDVPARYQHLTPKVQSTVREKEIFVKIPEQELNLEELWKDLQNYASRFAWVTMDASDPNTASFHGDVVNPMRRWLRDEPVYKLLHEDAIAYFEKKAKEDPQNWGQWMSNAVYHKFQLEGAGAASYWRELIAGQKDPVRRLALASEIIGSEYVDDELTPRQLRNDEPIIDLQTLVEAYFQVASASLDLAEAQQAPSTAQIWSEMDNALRTSERLQKRLPRSIIPPAALSSIRASVLMSQGRIDHAKVVLEEALTRIPDDHFRVALEHRLALVYNLKGDYQRAVAHAESSLQGADRLALDAEVMIEIRRTLARLHREHFELEASAAELSKALDSVSRADLETRSQLSNELREVYFAMGEFTRAKDAFDQGSAIVEDSVSLIRQLRYLNHLVRYYLAVEDPRRALSIVHDIDDFMRWEFYSNAKDEDASRLKVLGTQAIEQRGMLRGVVLEIENARRELETARVNWHDLGNSKATRNCMIKKAELFLTAGEINEAKSILDEAARLSVEPDVQQDLEEVLLRAGIQYYRSQPDLGNRGFNHLYDNAVQGYWPPQLKAKLIIHAGALRPAPLSGETANQFCSNLTDTLRPIRPLTARMLLLEPLRHYESFRKLDYHVAQELIDLFPLNRSDEDFKVHAPKLAELLRVLGRRDQAVALLMDLISSDGGDNPFASRGVLFTLGRTSPGRFGRMRELNQFIERFLNDYQSFPVLCGATLVEIAEFASTMRSSERLRLLDQAEGLLMPNAEHSQWMARLFARRGRLLIKERREEALDQLNRAIVIHEGLGNNLAARKLKRFVARQKQPQPSLASRVDIKDTVTQAKAFEAEARQTTIHIAGNWTETVTINTTFSDDQATSRYIPIEPESLLDKILAFDTYENYSFSFLRTMDENWIATCYGLGQILMDEKQGQKLWTQVTHHQYSALRLIIDALQLSAAPWEMMVMPSHPDTPASVSPTLSSFYRTVGLDSAGRVRDLRWLQKCLMGEERAVALMDNETEDAVRTFQQQQGISPHGRFDGLTRRTLKRLLLANERSSRPRVLLLRPGIERQRSTSRGDEVLGFSLEDRYSRLGFSDLAVVEDPHVVSVQKILSTFEPDVVHICPTMEESSSIGIFLDFGTGGTGVLPGRKVKSDANQRADAGGDVQFLTLSALAELIRAQQKPDRARPLLILDVLEPAGRTELLTQLFLRNAFAAQLYELGAFESIIATGLTPPDVREDMLGTLISAIANFESVGETVNRIRRLTDLGSYTRLPPVGDNLGPLRDTNDDKYLSRVVATAGTALFTPDPEM